MANKSFIIHYSELSDGCYALTCPILQSLSNNSILMPIKLNWFIIMVSYVLLNQLSRGLLKWNTI